MKGDEAILCVQYFFQRLVDSFKQLVQIGGLIQCVHYFRDDLALSLHALQGRHIEKTRYKFVDRRVTRAVADCRLEPAPLSRFALQAAAAFLRIVGGFAQLGQLVLYLSSIVRMDEIRQRPPDEFLGMISKGAERSRARMKENSVGTEDREQFARAIQQRGELFCTGRYAGLKRRVL